MGTRVIAAGGLLLICLETAIAIWCYVGVWTSFPDELYYDTYPKCSIDDLGTLEELLDSPCVMECKESKGCAQIYVKTNKYVAFTCYDLLVGDGLMCDFLDRNNMAKEDCVRVAKEYQTGSTKGRCDPDVEMAGINKKRNYTMKVCLCGKDCCVRGAGKKPRDDCVINNDASNLSVISVTGAILALGILSSGQ